MPITTRQRTSIFQKLLPVLGEEDADVLIAQFPAEHDVLVTREHLRAELSLIRAEMATKADVAELRAELSLIRAEMADLRGGMATKADVAELRAEMADLRGGMATKADLAGMATKADLAELRTEVHALMNRAVFASIGAMGTVILGTGWILAFG